VRIESVQRRSPGPRLHERRAGVVLDHPPGLRAVDLSRGTAPSSRSMRPQQTEADVFTCMNRYGRHTLAAFDASMGSPLPALGETEGPQHAGQLPARDPAAGTARTMNRCGAGPT
jgi:hypothetical protein